MKKIIFFPLLIMFCSLAAFAQGKPFNNLNAALKTEGSFLVGFKEVLSEAFNEDRKVLGDSFESELWKYLGDDVNRHYYLGLFLVKTDYLYGNAPLPELALKMWYKGVELAKEKNRVDDGARQVSLLIVSAITAEKSGKSNDAASYKTQADSYVAAHPGIRAYDLALNAYEICLYRGIGAGKKNCVEPAAPDSSGKEKILSAGMAILGKAIFTAIPVFPKEMKGKNLEGEVLVEFVVGETGKVISAKAIKGPVEFYQAAETAALQGKFRVPKLAGKPVKMSGIFRYTFYRDGRINMF